MIKHIKREQIVERLKEDYGYTSVMCEPVADEMIEKCPEELELNVQEWLDHKEEYTEIMVGELSIPKIYRFSPLPNFPNWIIAIGDYDKEGRDVPDAYLMRFAIL